MGRAAIARARDGGEVNEDLLVAIVRRDEPCGSFGPVPEGLRDIKGACCLDETALKYLEVLWFC